LHELPTVDVSNNENIEVSLSEGLIQAVITIPIKESAETPKDDISVNSCRYLIFASGSGYSQGSFSKHDSTPVASTEKYCFLQGDTSAMKSINTSLFIHVAACLALLLL